MHAQVYVGKKNDVLKCGRYSPYKPPRGHNAEDDENNDDDSVNQRHHGEKEPVRLHGLDEGVASKYDNLKQRVVKCQKAAHIAQRDREANVAHHTRKEPPAKPSRVYEFGGHGEVNKGKECRQPARSKRHACEGHERPVTAARHSGCGSAHRTHAGCGPNRPGSQPARRAHVAAAATGSNDECVGVLNVNNVACN